MQPQHNSKYLDRSTIQRIIKKCYSTNQQTLYLSKFPNQWYQVLKAEDWFKLEKLLLKDCVVKDEQNLSILKKLTKLIGLNLGKHYNMQGNCHITYKTINILSDCRLHNIKQLQLSNNQINNLGAKWLSKCNLINMEELQIDDCQIRGQGFIHLGKANWPHLKILKIEQKKFHQNQQIRNKLEVGGWQSIHINNWKNLRHFFFYQKQPILLMNYVLIRSRKLRNLTNQKFSIQDWANNRKWFQMLREVLYKRSNSG